MMNAATLPAEAVTVVCVGQERGVHKEQHARSAAAVVSAGELWLLLRKCLPSLFLFQDFIVTTSALTFVLRH